MRLPLSVILCVLGLVGLCGCPGGVGGGGFGGTDTPPVDDGDPADDGMADDDTTPDLPTDGTPVAQAHPAGQATRVATDGEVNTIFALDGTASFDLEGDTLSYLWTQTAGPDATFDDPTSATPIFTVDRAGLFVVQLVVSDGERDSAADTFEIRVFDVDTVSIPGPGTQFTFANQDQLTFTFTYAGLPENSEFHVLFLAAQTNDDGTATLVPVAQDYRFAAENTPNAALQLAEGQNLLERFGLDASTLGAMRNLAFVAPAGTADGVVNGTVTFTAPQLLVDYDAFLVEILVFTPAPAGETDETFRIDPLTEDPTLRYNVGPSS